MDRRDSIKRIREALKTRSGRPWNVTPGNRGEIIITAPYRRIVHGFLSPRMNLTDATDLQFLLALDYLPFEIVAVPEYDYDEYVKRAEGDLKNDPE